MTTVLKSYVYGEWFAGDYNPVKIHNPTTEEALAACSTRGIDFGKALSYARQRGGQALRAMSFAERGKLLMAMSKALHAHREELLDLETQNGGNTRSDGKFDVDGGIGTLASYAKLGETLGDSQLLSDESTISLSQSPRWVGRHVYAPLQGVAIHINAFNFPIWGFAEKAATAILAGMPVVTKPATSTSLVAARAIEILVESGVIPDGVLSCITGSVGDLFKFVDWQDAVAFTGSSSTGLFIRSSDGILINNVRVNIEADSLNAAIIDADLDPDSETYDLFLREVARDITQKAGQKCTAIRRIFVPESMLEQVRADLTSQLEGIRVGNPSEKGIRMGPLATARQLRDALTGLEAMQECTKTVFGDGGRGTLHGVEDDKGYFLSPHLLEALDPEAAEIHDREIFGPVATIIPYDGTAERAIHLTSLGRGSLVSSVYSDNNKFLQAMAVGLAPFNGRLHLASSKIAEHSIGPGTVLPQLLHGGPGRAGGGQELGGIRGMTFYMQRVALQGYAPFLEKLS